MTERRAWDRFWALGAKHWDVAPLVAVLPEEARSQWFRMWLSPSPTAADPALRARGEALERATLAVGRLVAGRDGAPSNPVIAELRGPRTVGAALDAKERPSRDLWGERPGPSWLVLEALARQRGHEPDAALVPLEVGDRSGEAARGRLGARIAEAAGDLPLAMSLAEDVPGTDGADRARRVRLLLKAGRSEDAAAAWREELRRLQPKLSEPAFRGLARAADEIGLADPLSLLDPAQPVPGVFLAFLCDVRGLAACRALQPVGAADFRSALAQRYQRRARPLSAEETRYALRELWANDAGALPVAGLRKLGGPWAQAAAWLRTVRSGERREAIAALEALPDDAGLAALLAREETLSSDASLLQVRALLMKGEDDKARSIAVQALAASGSTSGLTFTPISVTPGSEEGAEEGFEAESTAGYEAVDVLVSSIRTWLAVFREAGKAPLIEDAAREALLRRTAGDPHDAAAWALALDLSKTAPARAALLSALERVWRLGDLDATTVGPIAAAAGRVSAADADRWLARLRTGPALTPMIERANVLADLGRTADAARVLAAGRNRGGWTAGDEIKAFDRWRRLAPASETSPEPWVVARVFWTKPATAVGTDLLAHLREHPLDLRAARASLRSAAPADEEMTIFAARALRQPGFEGETWHDQQLLQLRAGRSWLARSPVVAQALLASVEPSLAEELERRRLPRAEVTASLLDVARALGSPRPGVTGTRATGAAVESTLAALEDRDAATARTLREELLKLAHSAPPPPYRIANGRPEAWRPMDLDWNVVQSVLDAEGIR